MLGSLREHMDDLLADWRQKRFLLAVSGGLDSVTLAHLLYDLGCEFSIAHCNYQLRGAESDEDQEFVVDLAHQLDRQVYTRSFDTNSIREAQGGSVQMVARELRYTWFKELLQDRKLDMLITAHQADDDLETLLINLMRGTGLRGLTGINQLTEQTLRPFLPFEKQDILTYAKAKGYHWREDSSNKKTDYLRNQLRLEVIPLIKQIKPQVLGSVQHTLEHLKGSQGLVDDYIELIRRLVMSPTDGGYQLDIEQLQKLPHSRAVLYELLSPYGFTAWEDIHHLLKAQSGKQVLSGSHRLIRDRDVLILTRLQKDTKPQQYWLQKGVWELTEPLKLIITRADSFETTNANTVFLDEQKLQFPLQLRRWSQGDYFHPFGMKGSKKLSKYFKDEKLSLTEKENLWLLCSAEQIVWIIGYRMDERFKVDRQSEKIIKIEYVAHEGNTPG